MFGLAVGGTFGIRVAGTRDVGVIMYRKAVRIMI